MQVSAFVGDEYQAKDSNNPNTQTPAVLPLSPTPAINNSLSTSSTSNSTEIRTTAPPASGKEASKLDDNDYNFLSERLPDLGEEEYMNLSDDANPLHFLKQQQKQPGQDPQAPPSPPIYITIPIYINTAGKLPLSLTIGGQELSVQGQQKEERRFVISSASSSRLKSPSPQEPNSHFNRLLHEIETPKRRPTNRHKNQRRR